MKKVCVVGHFGFGEELLNGQTVKTKILAEELERRYGAENVERIDTRGGAKMLLKLPFVLASALRRCGNIVILPAENGLRAVTPILTFWNRFYRRDLHYAVVGGWLAGFLKERRGLCRQLSRFRGVYVETSTMQTALEALGMRNVTVMPNCKYLTVLPESEVLAPQTEPYRLATFSRVMREKGIGDAVEAVRALNEAAGRTVYTLDIYGQVDAGQTEWFADLQKTFPPYIRYGGLIPFSESVETLKGCFALLFPTRFFTEGIPGTVIDAYAAGVPVVSARWESYADLIDEGVTGVGYPLGDTDAFRRLLSDLAEDPDRLTPMRLACTEKAEKYTPARALEPLAERLG